MWLAAGLKVSRKIHAIKSTYQDEIAKLLHLHTRLEWKLELAALDDDVREIQQMDLKRVFWTPSVS